jgi:hypothetical protein
LTFYGADRQDKPPTDVLANIYYLLMINIYQKLIFNDLPGVCQGFSLSSYQEKNRKNPPERLQNGEQSTHGDIRTTSRVIFIDNKLIVCISKY